ncbi:MAG TPA: biotin transporter BioY [Actinomycetota bacterium]|nr:biotin transporter BioY [Actinomycetota bacterium]
MTALAQALPRPRSRPAALASDVALIVGGSLFVAALAQVSVPLPFTPVPISGQTLGVLLVGTSFGWSRGALTLALYLLWGAIGLPFYAEAKAGAAFLGPESPTGGYLWGFLLAATLTGWLANRGWDRRFVTAVAVMVAGNVLIYLLGVPWLAQAIDVPLREAMVLGLFPFLIGDALKLVVAAGALPLAWRLVPRDRR